MNAAVIALRDIVKTYHMGEMDIQALKGVSLDIARGEMVAIMGASGSGKSTLMYLLGCMDRPTAGQYFLEGQDISRLKPDELAKVRNQKFGFVFQNFSLLARTSALENVELPMQYWSSLSGRECRTRAKEALERVGLGDRMTHHPSQLSGGQQQRVAIARALVNHPAVLLADEPTGNLDTRSEAEILSIFRQLHEQGMTVILVTHNPEIGKFAQRTIRIRDGLIQQEAAA